ncbi:MAG TPA: SIMPL domain-containing protein [Microbacterium sp.]|uniref:SIMPL domain-containing protein n=1 Tax=Microbacterium sp. TaxID=51671 RepID=UPI002B5BB969|nr:SIMPL domain-containing protein [Microbacterium sp.]HWI32251.1 SIMPL domain-containing protein [Microbacterium sp.]
MSEVIISVRGEHEDRIPAELGVARVSVRLDGPKRDAVLAEASALSQQVRDELQALQGAASVTQWSSDRVSVWSDRPWSQDGKRLALVHHASVGARAEFSDFAALSDWVTKVSEREGITVESVTWELTPDTAKATERQVAGGAVQVAVDRATAYAAAIGLGGVTALEIADVGLLSKGGEESGPGAPKMMRALMAADAGGGPALEFEPQPIVVRAAVEARFAAR